MKTKADFKKKEKGLGGNRRIIIKIITVALSVLALLITFNYMNRVADRTQRTVGVVRVKSNLKTNGIITYELINKDNVELYNLIEKEYDKANMILWENVDNIYGKYAAHFIRRATILYKDQLIDERPASYIPLEELPEGEELLTFPYNSSEAGGNILRPGDRVRIRISYEAERRIEADEENPNSRTSTVKYLQTDTIFDSIIITDMLNSNNNSIYTVYQEAMRLDEKQRQEMMKSSDFLSAVKPKALLLAATKEDVQNYAKYEAMSGTILITILRREEGTIDWGIMPFMIENEVGTWTDEGK